MYLFIIIMLFSWKKDNKVIVSNIILYVYMTIRIQSKIYLLYYTIFAYTWQSLLLKGESQFFNFYLWLPRPLVRIKDMKRLIYL